MGTIATPIKRCRLCHSRNLVRILSLGNQHVSDFVTAKGDSPRSPLELVRCARCNLVQLKHTFPRDSLYRHYWYRSGISSTMRKALEDIVIKACEVALPKEGDIVMDIGCNDGTLLRSYKIPGLKLVGFEPAKNLVEEARKGTTFVFNDFFGYDQFHQKFPGTKAKLITSVAMFYDLDDPDAFVADIAKCLEARGVWVIQQNYLCSMLQQNGFDNIGHEHLTYYSLETMSKLLSNHDLEIFDVEKNDVNGGSFRTFVAQKGQFPVRKSVETMKKSEKKLFSMKPSTYSTFAKNVQRVRSQLSDFIKDQTRNGRTVYVYGASTRGNTILQYCKLDRHLIKKATDANPEKWGLKTPGTQIPIVSKDEARRDKPDFFLVLPHHFLKEIMREEQEYLESGGKLIVPLPEFRIAELSDMQ
ncbi:class I SAM-dependent methyltransferase [Candidatus Bathyarchaeota archaeon]|nr:MAG: class I SAM-dependent methyltransferase [Candidatus Bathyarchaeota archaeon]